MLDDKVLRTEELVDQRRKELKTLNGSIEQLYAEREKELRHKQQEVDEQIRALDTFRLTIERKEKEIELAKANLGQQETTISRYNDALEKLDGEVAFAQLSLDVQAQQEGRIGRRVEVLTRLLERVTELVW